MKATFAAVTRSARLAKVFLAIVCAMALIAASTRSARAAIIFKIQDTTVISNGINPTSGTLHALLQLTGSDLSSPLSNVASINVAFQTGPTAQLAFAAPQEPSSGGLISGGNVFTGASDLPNDIIRFADDAVAPVAAVNNARLVSVPFTINAGVNSATFPVSFILGNELSTSTGQTPTLTLTGGTITVQPIPEPHTIVFAVLASLLALARRRHR
jgi:hypothetical protein